MTDPDLFSQPDPSPITGISGGYSYATSLHPFLENKEGKQQQAERVLNVVKSLGQTNLLQISNILGIESGRVSARCGDLIKAGKVKYDGIYEWGGRKRKRIVIC